jgi:hypothetical protein
MLSVIPEGCVGPRWAALTVDLALTGGARQYFTQSGVLLLLVCSGHFLEIAISVSDERSILCR